jgi:hypothetical protein
VPTQILCASNRDAEQTLTLKRQLDALRETLQAFDSSLFLAF